MASNDTDDLSKWNTLTWSELTKQKASLENQLGELIAMKEQGDMLIKDSDIKLIELRLQQVNQRLEMDSKETLRHAYEVFESAFKADQ